MCVCVFECVRARKNEADLEMLIAREALLTGKRKKTMLSVIYIDAESHLWYTYSLHFAKDG